MKSSYGMVSLFCALIGFQASAAEPQFFQISAGEEINFVCEFCSAADLLSSTNQGKLTTEKINENDLLVSYKASETAKGLDHLIRRSTQQVATIFIGSSLPEGLGTQYPSVCVDQPSTFLISEFSYIFHARKVVASRPANLQAELDADDSIVHLTALKPGTHSYTAIIKKGDDSYSKNFDVVAFNCN